MQPLHREELPVSWGMPGHQAPIPAMEQRQKQVGAQAEMAPSGGVKEGQMPFHAYTPH